MSKRITDPLLFDGGDEDAEPEISHYKIFEKTKSDKWTKEDKKERIGFIKKVYGILLAMLLTTVVIMVASFKVEGLKTLVNGKAWIPCFAVAVLTVLLLYFAPGPGEKKLNGKADDKGVAPPLHVCQPINYILLAVFTICMSICVAKISHAMNRSKPGVVFEAAVLTTGSVIGITIFAFTGLNNVDGFKELSYITPTLSALGVVFGLGGIMVFAPVTDMQSCPEGAPDTCDPEQGKQKRILYGAIAALVFCLIFLFDTNALIGGTSSMFKLGPETFILAAIQLYIEIVNIFVLLMVILGEAS